MATPQARLGVLGGSFDPPHVAHLAIASEACHALQLERVLFVPAAAPPHKGGGARTPAEIRLELTSLAIDDDLRFTASGVEIERGLVYTVDTLRALNARYVDHDLVFIMGSDSLLQVETWHAPEELLSLCSLAVAPRPGDSPEEIAAAAARLGGHEVTLLDVPALDVSSTSIRARVARRQPIRYLVPRRVEQYIQETRLYL
jgi:nicotinate-nucleotide adenylyltransferase